MAVNEYDISQLYNVAFGRIGNKFVKPENQPVGDSEAYEALPVVTTANGFDVDASLNYSDFYGNPLFMPLAIGGVQLPNEPIVTITVRKKIVETELVGSTRNGSVVELIGIDNYKITVQGVAITYGNSKIYPKDEVAQLHEIFKLNQSLAVASPLTKLLGIDKVVVTSFRLSPMAGIEHAQAYEFTMMSDADFILQLD